MAGVCVQGLRSHPLLACRPMSAPLPHLANSHRVAFGRLAPTVVVADIGRAVEFYRDVLGMVPVFENGNPVSFTIVERDQAELHLALDPAHEAREENVAHLLVSDAAALYDHLVGHGGTIVGALRDADYGMRTFVFADPDGNRIDVGQYL